MAASISESAAHHSRGVIPELDTPGFHKGLDRFLKNLPFSSGSRELVLDALAPRTPKVHAAWMESPALARTRFERACSAEADGIPVPRPLAWAEADSGKAVYFSESIPHTRTFREALLYHYYEQPLCEPLMRLLQVCADAVRALHESGWEHGDLTVDDLLVQGEVPGKWTRAWILGIVGADPVAPGPLPADVRGRDNARVELPSDFRRVFQEMQFAPDLIPEAFRTAERKARKRAGTPASDPERPFPPEQDIWIWDHRSMQAIPALKSRDKRPYYRKQDLFAILGTVCRWGPSVRRETRQLLETAWTEPVALDRRIGLSLNIEPDRFEPELRWLEPLGRLSLLVRLYHHETEANQLYGIEAIRRLHAEGHSVTVALVQDRRAVLQPKSWQRFVERAAGSLSGFAEALEIGHAINRVKWGFWNVPEYQQFVEPFRDWYQRYPQLPLLGPAGIDFEFPRLLPMLDQWPAGSLSAFSHHMYVDRRGPPEGKQAGMDLVGKLAMARALARVHPACAEKVIVSEVNWPLAGTGVWSPVGSPYQSPGERHGDPSVDEETYAVYLRRYLLLALCSGMADRVYWWNLAAHGFGLVDDRDPAGWRPRPGYHAFQEMVEAFRGSTFLRREAVGEEWTYHFTRGEETLSIATPRTENLSGLKN